MISSVAASRLVELALDHHARARHARDVLERRRDLSARAAAPPAVAPAAPDRQDTADDNGCHDQPHSDHHGYLPRLGFEERPDPAADGHHATQP